MSIITLPLAPADIERLERRDAARIDRLRQARADTTAYVAATQTRRRPRWQRLLSFPAEWELQPLETDYGNR